MAICVINPHDFEDFHFFSLETCQYFIPHIRCVAELQVVDSRFTEGGGHLFKVYFSYGLSIDLLFETAAQAAASRRDVINRIIEYWGLDQVVFSCGIDYDVIVVAGIRELTDVFEKDHHAGFAATVADVPYPVHLIFPNRQTACAYHECLSGRIEEYRRRNALKIAV